MGKTYARVHRKDSVIDHVHALPDEGDTGGMISKPNGMHAHLYNHGDKVMETSVASSTGDHVHDTIGGHTSGPITKASKLEPAKEAKTEDQHGITGGVHPNKRLDARRVKVSIH
jgi:hypothetical protein